MQLTTIEGISIVDRHRKDMGDLNSLATSIQSLGLLHPIGITSDRRLVFGERRLRACRDILKHTEILARTIDVNAIISGEYAENEIRKDFTPSERVAIAISLKAQIPERRGNPSIRHTRDELEGRTDALAAKRAGFTSRGALRRATKVVAKGSTALVAAMDRKAVPMSLAAEIADLSVEDQEQLLELDSRLLRQRARVLHRNAQAQQLRKRTPSAPLPRNLVQRSGQNWMLTNSQDPVPAQVVIVQPSFGSAREQYCFGDLQAPTLHWGSVWAEVGARFIAVLWQQHILFEGRKLLDEALCGYRYEQLLIWHNKPSSENGNVASFGTSWQPIFLYGQFGSQRGARTRRSDGFLQMRDCHVVEAFDGPPPSCDPTSRLSQRLGTKQPFEPFEVSTPVTPVSVMRWLVEGLSRPGEQIVSLFCGQSPCGIAGLELKRKYHGVEEDVAKLNAAANALLAVPREAPRASSVGQKSTSSQFS